jgi:hypothetical protein
MTSQSKSLAFEIAIVDGINLFVQKVLISKGIIPADKADDIGLQEIIDLKYEIARSLAKQWAKMPMHDDP